MARSLDGITEQRKKDALELANLIYDIFKEEQANARLYDGGDDSDKPNESEDDKATASNCTL